MVLPASSEPASRNATRADTPDETAALSTNSDHGDCESQLTDLRDTMHWLGVADTRALLC
jgi:hypothetical protein